MTQTEEQWQRCQFCGNPKPQTIYEDGKCDKCHSAEVKKWKKGD